MIYAVSRITTCGGERMDLVTDHWHSKQFMLGKLLDYTCIILILCAISHHMTEIWSEALDVLTKILVNNLTLPEAEIALEFS